MARNSHPQREFAISSLQFGIQIGGFQKLRGCSSLPAAFLQLYGHLSSICISNFIASAPKRLCQIRNNNNTECLCTCVSSVPHLVLANALTAMSMLTLSLGGPFSFGVFDCAATEMLFVVFSQVSSSESSESLSESYASQLSSVRVTRDWSSCKLCTAMATGLPATQSR